MTWGGGGIDDPLEDIRGAGSSFYGKRFLEEGRKISLSSKGSNSIREEGEHVAPRGKYVFYKVKNLT